MTKLEALKELRWLDSRPAFKMSHAAKYRKVAKVLGMTFEELVFDYSDISRTWYEEQLRKLEVK